MAFIHILYEILSISEHSMSCLTLYSNDCQKHPLPLNHHGHNIKYAFVGEIEFLVDQHLRPSFRARRRNSLL